MKKAVLFVASGAVLYTAGYFTRYSTHSSAEPQKKESSALTTIAAQSGAAAGKTAEQRAAVLSVRAFSPGRPFPKGSAKAWLLTLAGMDFDDESRLPELLDTLQAVMTMDEDCARELTDALFEIAQLIEKDDPALKAIPNADDMVEGGLTLALVRLSQFNPEAALAMMTKYPDMADGMAMGFVFGRLAAQNPQRAEELAMKLPEESRGDALEAVLKSMSSKDPKAALAFAQKHPEEIAQNAVNDVLTNWAKREPQQAMTEAAKITDGMAHMTAVQNVFHQWMEKDSKAAEAWASAYDGPDKTILQASLLEKRVEEDPAGVLGEFAALQKTAKDEKELFSLTHAIAYKMAATDIPGLRNWIDSLAPGESKDAATGHLMREWVKADPIAASAWIKAQPPGDARDDAAALLSGRIVRRDPAAAMEWARSIQSESSRVEQISKVLEAWEEQDPEAAKAARAALPPEDLEEKKDPTEFDPPAVPQR